MPQNVRRSGPQLEIRIDSAECSPGGTITGCVFRKAHMVSPRAAVTISLHGRSKTKMVVSRGNSSSTYRGRFDLISAARNNQKIFDGPLHIPVGSEGQAWPFSVTLPTHIETSGFQPGASQSGSYISLGPGGDAARHSMPLTFTVQNQTFGARMHGFIEFFLQAELRATTSGSTGAIEAVMPVRVVARDPGPIVDFGLRSYRPARSVSSYRLIPGNEDAALKFSQKMQKLFGSAKVPSFVFSVEVRMPTIVQTASAYDFPFSVQASPEWSKCSEIIQGAPQTIILTKVSLKLVAETEIKCEGTLGAHHDNVEDKVALHVFVQNPQRAMRENMPGMANGLPVDIGQRVTMSAGVPAFHPSFTSFNIRHTHRLKWDMTVHVAGEDTKVVGSHFITVIAPSARLMGEAEPDAAVPGETARPAEREGKSWIKPPEEGPAPPSFAEAQGDVVLQESERKGEQ